MTREQVLIVLGAIVLLSPWSGLPLSWLEWILPVIGIMVVAIGYTIWKRNLEHTDVELPVIHSEPISPNSRIALS